MLIKLIRLCGGKPGPTLACVAAACLGGWWCMKSIPIDAIPDLSDTQVIVHSQWNVGPNIIEDQVTYPIVTALLGVPKVVDIRGLSTFGASYVTVIFEDGTDIYWARSRVLEYLSQVSSSLPGEVRTKLGPDATGVGWVYQYALRDTTGKRSLADLRSLQDWFLRYQLQAVAGVAEVASFGGFEKQYQVQVNPESLRAHKLSLSKLTKAIRQGNKETGARVIEFAGTEYMVRAKGYVKSRRDIENIVIGLGEGGVPVTVKNVARVAEGPDIRRGVGDLDGQGDTVGAIVIMRSRENAARVIERVKEKIADLRPSLPAGVEIVQTYDRSELIEKSIATLRWELILEMTVVALVITVFLLHLPSAAVAVITLPAAVLISFILMRLMNVSANIMSLGGIAIAIGAMVDAAIVVVENCHKKIEEWKRSGSPGTLRQVIVEAVTEVGPAAFYSLMVIAVSFLPIFALESQEGRLFRPLAYTKTFAMLAAAFLSITLAPALLTILLKGGFKSEERHPISRFLFRLYGPVVDQVVDHRRKVIALALAMVLASVPIAFKLGSEFMPPLNEGVILYMPTTMPGISVGEAQRILQRQDQILKSFPEVLRVHGKAGRADTATDPAPLSMMETVVVLKDQRQWRKVKRWYSFLPDFLQWPFRFFAPDFMSWEELISRMDQKMDFPGLTNAWTLPIKGRIDMLTTGIRTPVGIKIAGHDMEELQRIGIAIEREVGKMEGVRSVFAERATGGFFFDFNFNREALARHGISVEEAQKVLASALGGRNVTQVVDGRERYAINVRYARAFRRSKQDIGNILLESSKGHPIPLSEVATMELSSGPGVIRNDGGLLTSYVYIDLATSDLGGFVAKAKPIIKKNISLPPGHSLTWSGQYESLQRVRKKLTLLLPLTAALIILLIALNTRSATKTLIVLLAVPFSAIGAFWLLYFLDYNMSVAVWVGLIALLGVDAETAIYMLLYLDLSYKKRKEAGQMENFAQLKAAIHEGAVKRIRPKAMTALTTLMALLPILWASSANSGADVMKRMAAPMVGGILTSFALELLVYPAIFALWRERKLPK